MSISDFPGMSITPPPTTPEIPSIGMTVRDYYACAALSGMLSSGYILDTYNRDKDFKYLEAAFVIADDMLKLR